MHAHGSIAANHNTIVSNRRLPPQKRLMHQWPHKGAYYTALSGSIFGASMTFI